MTISPRPWLAITPGEPAGIGPDLVVRWLHIHAGCTHDFRPIIVADPELLRERASRLGIALELQVLDAAATPDNQPDATNPAILPVPLACPSVPGRLDPANAKYVLETLTAACDGCLAERFAALITAPVHKGVINDAGIPFTGHTEYLARHCRADPVMMLAAPGLRVALVTTHLPLGQVSAAMTPEHLQRVIEILHRDLVDRFGIARPRILVCGLNPHAGEGGYLGCEEQTIITPVLEQLRTRGWNLIGPLPADTAFVPRQLQDADAVLAMYHDQGLPVLKHLGFGQAVNITLGLPIVRTSVDHGTALDLAGTNRADLGSLQAALTTALEMTTHRSRAERYTHY